MDVEDISHGKKKILKGIEEMRDKFRELNKSSENIKIEKKTDYTKRTYIITIFIIIIAITALIIEILNLINK